MINDVQSHSPKNLYSTDPKKEDLSCEDFYKLGCIAEDNGLLDQAKNHFSNVLKLVQTEKMKPIIKERLEYLNSVIDTSNKSTNINLSNLSILDDSKLQPFLHNNLLILNLYNCLNITKTAISSIAEKCFALQELSLSNCSNITSIENGLKSAIEFKKLEFLDISDCSNLKTLRLYVPLLKLLKARNDNNLEIIEINAPISVKIDTENSAKIDVKTLEINSVITDLDLSSCGIGKSIAVLDEVIKINFTITNLDLSFNNLGEDTLYLAEAFKENKTLKVLNLHSNNISSKSIRVLAKSLETHPSITHLDLGDNHLGGNMFNGNTTVLGELIQKNSSLTHLYLSGNKFNNFEASSLTLRYLGKNSTLTHLDLRANEIGFFGMASIFQGLDKNNTLSHLNLSSNQIECNNVKRINLLKKHIKNNALEELDLSKNKITDKFLQAIKELEKFKQNFKVIVTFEKDLEENI